MVPQVLVDGISIFKLLQVALITVKAKRYSNTDTHIYIYACAHTNTHTHIHSQILWNPTTVESTLSLFKTIHTCSASACLSLQVGVSKEV